MKLTKQELSIFIDQIALAKAIGAHVDLEKIEAIAEELLIWRECQDDMAVGINKLTTEILELREKEKWIYALETLPANSKPVLAWIYNHSSKRHMGIVLKRVFESDCSWRTVDDNSELHNGVDVLYWKPITPPQEGS